MSAEVMKIPSGGTTTADVNVLWDGGSTLSMITFKKAKEMKLTGKKVKLTIVKIGGVKEHINSYQYEVPLKDQAGETVHFQAYGIQRISTAIEPIEAKSFKEIFENIKDFFLFFIINPLF